PVVGHQNHLRWQFVPKLTDFPQRLLDDCYQIQCRLGVQDLLNKIEPTEILGHTPDTVRLTVFGHVVSKISLQYFVELPRCLEHLAPTLGCFTQITADSLRLEQTLALKHPITAHPTARGTVCRHFSPRQCIGSHPTVPRFHSFERYLTQNLTVLYRSSLAWMSLVVDHSTYLPIVRAPR